MNDTHTFFKNRPKKETKGVYFYKNRPSKKTYIHKYTVVQILLYILFIQKLVVQKIIISMYIFLPATCNLIPFVSNMEL